MLLREIIVGFLLVIAFKTMLHATPTVVRTSDDLRGSTYATVWGDGFREGKTKIRILTCQDVWTETQAQESLDLGPILSVAGQSPSGTLSLEPLRVRSDLMLIQLNLPENPTPTVLWVESDGQSSFGWVVNRPQVWWLSTDRVEAGKRVRGFGRNLLGGLPQKQPLVFIKRNGESARACQFAGGGIDGNVTDPLSLTYETSFIVPADTPPGHYEVWFHSGTGGQYGWSRPQEIEITMPEKTSDFTVEVASYGAKADGVTDDTLAIVLAIMEVQEAGGGTVILPSGTLLISNVITLPAKVNLRGAGINHTVIAINPRQELHGFLNICLMPKSKTPQENIPFWRKDSPTMLWAQTQSRLSDFTLNMDGLRDAGYGIILANGNDESRDCVFERIGTIYHVPEQQISLAGKWISGVHPCRAFSSVRRVRVSCCRDFSVGMEYGCKAWFCQGERNFNSPGINGTQITCSLIEENTIRDIYSRRGIMGSGQYVALFRNRVEETWLVPGGGEHYLREGGSAQPYSVVSANVDTLVVHNPPEKGAEGWWRVDDLTAVIALGRGKWQIRRITGFADGEYKMDKPWDLLPDNTSTVAIGPLQCRSLWVRNYSGGGVNSLSLCVGNVEQIVAGHELHNSGMMMNFGDFQQWVTAWFNEFRNNSLHHGDGMESQVSIYWADKAPPRLPIPVIAGCEWRDNLVEDVGFSHYGGSRWGDPRWREMFTQGAITIHTVRRDLQYDGAFQYGHLLTGNTIRRPRTGSGIFVDADTSDIFVAGNKFEDCPTKVSHYGRDRYENNN
jgi:hypothetical protein